MRSHAYVIPSEIYRELEPQILEQLRDGDRESLLYLLGEHDVELELLSGEWRLLFEKAEDFYQIQDSKAHRCRMAISPEELSDFVAVLDGLQASEAWKAIAFGLAELKDVLPVGADLVGVVFLEESDDWMWAEQRSEIQAIPEEIYRWIKPYTHAMIAEKEHASLARLCGDHCEGAVEFSSERWSLLREHCREKVPELDLVFEGVVAEPSDYTSIREALSLVSNPMFQPSLDAWLRVHADKGSYALYFRELERERE